MKNRDIPGLYGIRGVMSVCHLLVEGDRAWLLDTGMVGEPVLIRRLLHRLGLAPRSIEAILLTHGHLDHAGNLAAVKETSLRATSSTPISPRRCSPASRS